ncbi:hypothetical protein DTO013E5_5559 [Penicillium roqueforti]|uniref:Genomic scaffold, ProqFM164S04 n=1 Tax=Penicillium roqueforti (strain FM164) TaxID=1365484 RepID=W6QI24_PENRF|nr:hypothetical protein LCP963914a_6127 [Penicillium roqueforti]CDM36080.1 unnamed protein product [Penicillium roqueforti FM164]KAI2716347.1 hypothetical protein CBS147318_5461 [Penicillium roqueforti]KAI2728022.1 hypothetical protein CBS147354_3131 [Penicillium roqueforti]KAI2740518.1 hypothetical protein DTO012A1_5433 [Penicillium roqueforti]
MAENPTLMSDLPQGHVVSFSRLRRLRLEALQISKWFEEHTDGNQWIVVLGLSTPVIEALTSDHGGLGGIAFRFQWEGSTGLIKVVPRSEHEVATDKFTEVIRDSYKAMGVPSEGTAWIGSTTYRSGMRKGKEADNGYVPPSRCTHPIGNVGYPTLIIETGVSESLGRLRQDARKWFADSEGDVRMVVLIIVRKNYVSFEQWQLAPNGAPRPLTRNYIRTLQAQTPNIPPLIRQPARLQQPYCAQSVDITPNPVAGMPNFMDGDPMVLPFVAIQDRPPGPGEGDVVIGLQNFNFVTEFLL